MKKFILPVSLIAFILIFGRHLLPGSNVFEFHDVSQPGRIAEFVFDIKNLQIPPRVAPHMSYGMGYTVFNYYAPFSYWATSFLHIVGFDIPDSIKLSFLLALISAFVGMYFFLKQFFKETASLFGAALYTCSPYVAVEIFARGNLGEVWFLGLLPLVLYLLYRNSKVQTFWTFVLTALILSATLTVHNVLSLLFLPLSIVYIYFIPNYKRNYLALLCGVLLSSYFIIPAILESSFVEASKIAMLTNYKDHFLCLWQLWTTPIWGYGASNPGCFKDGISFMLGKVQVVTGLLGLGFLVFSIYNKKEELKKGSHTFIYILIGVLLLVSTFMTLYISEPLWRILPIKVFQFPWRFLIFALFGLSFFSAYLFSKLKHPAFQILIPICLIAICVVQSKYFYKPPIAKLDFSQRYLSEGSIREYVAYRVAEYLPSNGDYEYWRTVEANPELRNKLLSEIKDFIYPLDNKDYKIVRSDIFHKKAVTNSQKFVLNVHYMPYWQIKINNVEYQPKEFDKLARPVITSQEMSDKIVEVHFRQTPVEVIANFLTIVGFIITLTAASNSKKPKKEK